MAGINLSNARYSPGGDGEHDPGKKIDPAAEGGVGGGKGGGIVAPGANAFAGRHSSKKVEKPTPFYRSIDQLISIKHQLTYQYAVRDMLYRFLQKLYDGDYWRQISEDVRVGGFRYRRYKTDDKFRLVVNYSFSVTNDYVDLTSKEPSIHVPALHAADSVSQDQAALNEKILYGIWEASQMSKQNYDRSWYEALLGNAVLESTLDPQDNIPKIVVQHPGTHYMRERYGRPNEILYGIQRVFLEPAQVKDAFGNAWKDNGKYSMLDTRTGQWQNSDEWTPNMARIECVIFYSEWERTLMVQDQILNEYSVQFDDPIEVPFRLTHFLKRPGRPYGMGAVEQIWALNQYLNQLYSMEANIIAYAANPILVVKEPTQVPSDIPNDPGAVVSVGPQGDVHWLQWHQAVPELTQQMERTKKSLQDISGMPETRYGSTKQSFVTGRAIDQLNAPTQDRVASRLRLVGNELQHINRIALWQFEHGSFGKNVELYGQSAEGDSFVMSTQGKDVHGYYRNFVTWDNHDHGDAVEVLQLYGAGLMDRRSAIVSLGMREPDQIIKRIRQDKEEDIEITRLYEEARVVTISPTEVEGLIPGQEAILGPAGQEQLEAGLAAGGTMAPPTQQSTPGSRPLQQVQGGAQQAPVQGGPGGPAGTPPPAIPQTPGARTLQDHSRDLHVLRKGEVPPPPTASSPLAGPPGGLPPASPMSRPGGFGPDAGLVSPSRSRKGFGANANLHLQGGGSFNLQTVANDFRALPPDKIKGRIFLKGSILGGAADKIDVFLSNGLDKKSILDLLPMYNGKLNFEKGKNPPASAIEVTPKPFGPPPTPSNSPINAGAKSGSGLEKGAGLQKNPPGLVLSRGPGGIPTGYSQLPLPPPGAGAPQVPE